MIILIDGYNLLHQVYPGQKHHFDRLTTLLIKQLSAYKHSRSAISEVILVFDGGITNHAIRTIKAGITIIEAGTKSSADDWIATFVSRHRGQEMTLISQDRALKDRAASKGCDALGVSEFYTLVLTAQNAHPTHAAAQQQDLIVYNHEEDDQEGLVSKHAVDMLMMQASVCPRAKQEDTAQKRRAASGYTPSRAEKRLAGKLKKLR